MNGFPHVPGTAPFPPPWFFNDPTKCDALRAEARTWKSTPFAPDACAKGEGGGVYCSRFAQALYVAVGAIPPDLNFPTEPRDYQPHAHNDKVLDQLRGERLAQIFTELPVPRQKKLSAFRFEYVDPTLMCGDLLIMKTGNGLWHMPVMLDDRRFIQCAYPLGVSEGDFGDPVYNAHVEAVFRIRALSTLNPQPSAH